MPMDDSFRAPFDPLRRSAAEDQPNLDKVDEDPNKPDPPSFAERRSDYYEERHGKDSFYARRNRAREERAASREPAQQVSAEAANQSVGIGGGSDMGNKELVAAIRELIAAVRTMGGN